jgi:hypothetical protein
MQKPIPFLRTDGPLMVFGGPYSNLEATRAVLNEAARLAIPADASFALAMWWPMEQMLSGLLTWFATGLAML